MAKISLVINGKPRDVDVQSSTTLLELLRDKLKLKSLKAGCWRGDCGLCVVQINGTPAKSCLVLAREAEGTKITTVEGLMENGQISRLQKTFIDKGALQCGYCTPAFLLTTDAFLRRHPNPTREEVAEAMNGIICRCTGYKQIVDAVMEASSE